MSNIASANRDHFNKTAADYDTKPWQRKISALLLSELRNKLDLLDLSQNTHEHARLLDYACGTGLVSRALAPFVRDVRGIDISAAMVDRYNTMAKEDPDLAKCHAVAIAGDLCTEETPDAELTTADLSDFDVAAISLGFHHFDNTALAISRVAERLRPGGRLLIIDLIDEGQGYDLPEEARSMVKVHGFSEKGISQLFHDAGLTDFAFSAMKEPIELMMKGELKPRQVFLAKAIKPIL